MIALIGIYICGAGMCAIIGGLITENDDENEKNILKHAFYIQREIYEILSEEVNAYGVVFALILTSLFLLPCNMALLIIHLIIEFVKLLWRGFKFIFKKREPK